MQTIVTTSIWEKLLKRNYTLWEGQDCQYFARVLTECIGDETAIEKFDTFNSMVEAAYSMQAGFVGGFGASFSLLAIPDPTLTTQTLGAIAVMYAVTGSATVYLMGRKRNSARKDFVAKWRL
ncbi:hypothetical protein F5883DRAFT_676209 [Diaporthe sp. PMI_573]|nr:hypothetical protein F5883DRAFT_676209 [Diaporthaceae sp. PMI_573]